MFTPSERNLVIWLGAPPPPTAEQEFSARRIGVQHCVKPTDVLASIPLSRAIVCCLPSGSVNSLEPLLSVFQVAVENGLQVIISPEDTYQSRLAQKKIDEAFTVRKAGEPLILGGRPVTMPFTLASWVNRTPRAIHDIAERCARWSPGPPEKASLGLPSKLPSTCQILLRRAFNDCDTLEITPLQGGYSASVYKVHARFERRRLVDRPMPFYAKYDRLHKIERELRNYEDLVEAAVPFNMRPNPDYRRCIREGYTHGLIVGNFAEQSEPLSVIATRGHCGPVIFTLFDQAFRSWRLSSYKEASMESVVSAMEKSGWQLNVEISPDRLSLARSIGLTSELSSLVGVLRNLRPSPFRKGTIHGDLNAENVRARGSDPVLIDFYSVRPSAPLGIDPASLEISLAFRNYGKKDDDKSWLETIRKLYSFEHLVQAPEPALRSHKREWLWNAVRNIRLLALSSVESRYEYATIVAFFLISRLRHLGSNRHTDFRFAAGVSIAETILAELKKVA